MRYDFSIFFEKKLKELARCERVLDVGGGHPFQKRMARWKELFRDTRYETLDIAEIYRPTIRGDVHAIPLADASVDGILCNSVLEHLHDPKRACEEMHRVLKPGGKFLGYTHFIYPYHARRGVYPDYYRFSEDGLRYLFRQFSRVEIQKQAGYFSALRFFLPLQKYLNGALRPIAYGFDKMLGLDRRSTTAGYYVFAIK